MQHPHDKVSRGADGPGEAFFLPNWEFVVPLFCCLRSFFIYFFVFFSLKQQSTCRSVTTLRVQVSSCQAPISLLLAELPAVTGFQPLALQLLLRLSC